MCKNRQWIYSLIALIILLIGMCVDEVKVDSFSVCPQTVTGVMAEQTNAVIAEVELETVQLLCVRNAISSSQIIAQISNSRRTIKLSLVFLCVAIFSLLLSNFYTTERVAEYPRLSARTVLLNYIHNTDGKK